MLRSGVKEMHWHLYIYITKRLSQRKFQDNHGHGSVYYQNYVIFCRYLGLWTKYSTARMTCWPIEDFQPTSHIAMDQYLLIPFLVGYSHPFYPSYFDVNRRGTIGFDTLPYLYRWMCFEILRIGSMIKFFVFHAYWAAHVKIVIWHCFFKPIWSELHMCFAHIFGVWVCCSFQSFARSIR